MEVEKAARIEAETQAAELIEQKLLESQKMKELEENRIDLERLLEEEKQAKRDEEIVRNLQVIFQICCGQRLTVLSRRGY